MCLSSIPFIRVQPYLIKLMADRSVKPVDFRIEFRVFQSKIAKKLKEADRQALMYIYGDYIPESLKRATALELLSHLETEDVFSVYAPNTFVDILRHLERFDLAKEAEKYLKQTEKYFKQLSTKADKLKSKKTSQKPMFLTAEDAALKARFDCILLQATLQVEELEKLRVDLAAKDEQNQDSQELLKQCEESAAKLKCELRKARSASKLSDNSFSAATNVVTALKDVCDKVNALMPEGTPLQPSSVLELERAAQSAPNSPFNTMHRGEHATQFLQLHWTHYNMCLVIIIIMLKPAMVEDTTKHMTNTKLIYRARPIFSHSGSWRQAIGKSLSYAPPQLPEREKIGLARLKCKS